MNQEFRNGIRDGIPIGLGYFAVSFAFGITAVASGLTAWQAGLISLTNLTSAGQVGGLGIIAAGGSYWELALNQLIINLRYCLMSFSLSQKLDRKVPFYHRFIMSFGVTDEIFGISAAHPGILSPWYSYGAMCMAIPGWTGGTVIGALCGDILPQMVVSALKVAIYGMFVAIFIPPAKKAKPILGAVLGAMLISSLFTWIPALAQVPVGFQIIITTVLVAGAAAIIAPIPEKEGSHES